ncbi:J domain-containing protein [Nocardioides dongxiaopingii]|uniref:J domain-containing protein n=1 Tax=Nocardioides dongxiaopingii TaxID=2576036 RepID=UPI0010C76931|nr:J domain-containing protein [Nocardioides dongxiaopingii]
MTPSWYDVLGIEPDATPEQVRAAWKESIADLDPADRRFRQRNRAAEVLLDPARRAAHDADLAADDEDDLDPVDAAGPAADPATAGPDESTDEKADEPTDEEARDAGPALLVVAALGVLALLVVVATVWSFVGGAGEPAGADSSASAGGDLPDAREVAAARAAAETAIVPMLSYDFRSIEATQQAALPYLTPAYAEEYTRLFEGVIEPNATSTQTVVTTQVLSSGIVRTGVDRVDVLLFIDRPTRNATRDDVSRDQVTMQMVDVAGDWLVDCLITAPGGTCESADAP